MKVLSGMQSSCGSTYTHQRLAIIGDCRYNLGHSIVMQDKCLAYTVPLVCCSSDSDQGKGWDSRAAEALQVLHALPSTTSRQYASLP
ncbi:hypothetical protein DOTSEDRAFT_58473 [Dothistroma septosporum NZE10]|uniref:Uncharacterized protein n=1 Tax=Dothistroma septosporum (strain NZE10 / CBS 128990) TaxID=675120 RepID=N1Q4S3_DOTSN|nr:hypothetical protein DOTSEDRAFT_58473 [Dothistroma septosporum NZE10]